MPSIDNYQTTYIQSKVNPVGNKGAAQNDAGLVNLLGNDSNLTAGMMKQPIIHQSAATLPMSRPSDRSTTTPDVISTSTTTATFQPTTLQSSADELQPSFVSPDAETKAAAATLTETMMSTRDSLTQSAQNLTSSPIVRNPIGTFSGGIATIVNSQVVQHPITTTQTGLESIANHPTVQHGAAMAQDNLVAAGQSAQAGAAAIVNKAANADYKAGAQNVGSALGNAAGAIAGTLTAIGEMTIHAAENTYHKVVGDQEKPIVSDVSLTTDRSVNNSLSGSSMVPNMSTASTGPARSQPLLSKVGATTGSVLGSVAGLVSGAVHAASNVVHGESLKQPQVTQSAEKTAIDTTEYEGSRGQQWLPSREVLQEEQAIPDVPAPSQKRSLSPQEQGVQDALRVESTLNQLPTTIQNASVNAASALGDATTSAYNATASAISGAVDTAGIAATNAYNASADMANQAAATVSQTAANAYNTAANTMSGVTATDNDSAANKVTGVLDTTSEKAADAYETAAKTLVPETEQVAEEPFSRDLAEPSTAAMRDASVPASKDLYIADDEVPQIEKIGVYAADIGNNQIAIETAVQFTDGDIIVEDGRILDARDVAPVESASEGGHPTTVSSFQLPPAGGIVPIYETVLKPTNRTGEVVPESTELERDIANSVFPSEPLKNTSIDAYPINAPASPSRNVTAFPAPTGTSYSSFRDGTAQSGPYTGESRSGSFDPIDSTALRSSEFVHTTTMPDAMSTEFVAAGQGFSDIQTTPEVPQVGQDRFGHPEAKLTMGSVLPAGMSYREATAPPTDNTSTRSMASHVQDNENDLTFAAVPPRRESLVDEASSLDSGLPATRTDTLQSANSAKYSNISVDDISESRWNEVGLQHKNNKKSISRKSSPEAILKSSIAPISRRSSVASPTTTRPTAATANPDSTTTPALAAAAGPVSNATRSPVANSAMSPHFFDPSHPTKMHSSISGLVGKLEANAGKMLNKGSWVADGTQRISEAQLEKELISSTGAGSKTQ